MAKVNSNAILPADQVSVIVYTDPLCCWSWAMRPALDECFLEMGNAQVTYRMAGLLPSWKHFSDSVNAISKPIQMGPEWMHARAVTGATINDHLWIADPPASSWPACIAVKAAWLQSPELGERYLFLLQQAAIAECRNIARLNTLLEIAVQLGSADERFDIVRFEADINGSEARELFRRDMQEWKALGISRLPAIVVKTNGKGIVVSGYQTAASLNRAMTLLLQNS